MINLHSSNCTISLYSNQDNKQIATYIEIKLHVYIYACCITVHTLSSDKKPFNRSYNVNISDAFI